MYQPKYPIRSYQNGFILITSLLFLAIITMLALSGIGSSTLQQKMATNSNDKSASLQAANSTLAHAETLIRHMHGTPPNMTKPNVSYCKKNQYIFISKKNCNNSTVTIIIDKRSQRRSVSSWFDHNLWTKWKNNNKVQTYKPNNSLQTTFRIKVTKKPILPPGASKKQGQGLSASYNGKAKAYYFTITARSTGSNQKAPAITQSVYRKRY